MRLRGPVDTIVITSTTGYYVFHGSSWGHYTVSLMPETGWIQITPSFMTNCSDSLTLASNDIFSHLGSIADDAYWEYYLLHSTYVGYTLASSLASDDYATYELSSVTQDSLSVRATSLAGYGTSEMKLGAGGFSGDVRTTGSLSAYGGRIALGSYDLPLLRSAVYWGSRNYTWYDFAAASGTEITGTIYEDHNQNHQRDSGEAGITGQEVFFSGPTVDSAMTEANGDFHFQYSYPGAYLVTQGYLDGKAQLSPSASLMHPNRNALIRSMNSCREKLSIIAVDAYQYRVIPFWLGGGAGVYSGYAIPLRVRLDTLTSSEILSGQPTSIRFKVSSIIDPGSVSATLDITGKLSQFAIDGDFAQLGTVIVHADTVNGVEAPVNFGDIDSIVTSASDEIKKNIPREFTLYQNYPNPFNPVTEIRYDLPTESNVTLKIYSVLGQEVMTVLNMRETSGSKIVSIDAGKLSTGIYFYRLQAGEFSDIKKLLLLK